MRWRSLRLRLLLGALASIAVALVIAGFAIVTSFSASIEAERRNDLSASIDRLAAAIDPAGGVLSVSAPLTDPRFDTPLSGFYWQIVDLNSGEVLRSRSLWDQQLTPNADWARDEQGAIAETTGPSGEPLIMLSRRVTANASTPARQVVISVAEARSTDDDPIARFNGDLIIALCVLGAVLLLAAMSQVYFGLKPLTSLARKIQAVRDGQRQRLPASRTLELVPITEQVNELLDSHENNLAFARDRAADLAHGLKTPLAVLSATAARLRAANNTADADVLELVIEQMNSRIDYQLRVSRIRPHTRAMGVRASVNDVILRSVAVLRSGDRGRRLNWIVDLEEEFLVAVDPHDLMELAGILLENATCWARRHVLVRGTHRDGLVVLRIDDDGPGMTPDQIAKLGSRSARLDEAAPVHGIGLSIGLEIVRLSRGTIEFGESAEGGLSVTLSLPRVERLPEAQLVSPEPVEPTMAE